MNVKNKKVAFWTSIVFIVLTVASYVIAIISPCEFANNGIRRWYWGIIILSFSVSVLLLFFQGIKKVMAVRINKIIKCLIVVGRSLGIILFLVVFYIFTAYYSMTTGWETETIGGNCYTHQYCDLGAFGYKEREVILKPFMYFWVLPVDAKEKRIPNKNM